MELIKAIQGAREGLPEGFRALFDLTCGGVYFQSAMLLGPSGTALKTMQDAYTVAFSRLSELESPSDLRIWLGKSLYTCILTRNASIWQYPKDGQEGWEKVLRQFDKLSVLDCAVFLLSYYDGCSSAQCALILGEEEIQIKRRIRAAKKALEEGIEQQCGIKCVINAAGISQAVLKAAAFLRPPESMMPVVYQQVCAALKIEYWGEEPKPLDEIKKEMLETAGQDREKEAQDGEDPVGPQPPEENKKGGILKRLFSRAER